MDGIQNRAVIRLMFAAVGDRPGDAVTLDVVVKVPPEIAISAGLTSNHQASGGPYRYRSCSPLRLRLGPGSIEL